MTCPAQLPLLFPEAWPAPWVVRGSEVFDRDGAPLTDFAPDDVTARAFWAGICEAVNAHHGVTVLPALPFFRPVSTR